MSAVDLFLILPAVFTAFIVCYLSMPVVIRVAEMKQLIDGPDGNRKIHNTLIPTLGGVGIFAGFIISFSIWGQAGEMISYPFFMAALFMLFLVGVRDDILVLDPLKKLSVQIASAFLLVLGGGVVLTDLGGFLGFYEISYLAGVMVSALILVAITNAINLIDGIDGLAGGIGVIVSSILGIWFWGAGFLTHAVLAFALAAALIGFLAYNMHPAKIFMGDTGAMAIGFILGYLALEFLLLNGGLAGQGWHISNAHVFILAALIVPIVDTIRVAMIRIVNGKNPFMADRNHIHHKLIELGQPQHYTAFSLWLANMFVIGLAYSISFLEVNLQIFIIMAAGFGILPILKVIYLTSLRFQPDSGESNEKKNKDSATAFHAS